MFGGGIMGLKEIYYKLENGYYKVLDKIDRKIPIYKVIEPIDKVFPSFILFLAIIILIAAFAILPFLFGLMPFGHSLDFRVSDYSTGEALGGATVFVMHEDLEEDLILLTDEEGFTQPVLVHPEMFLEYRVELDGYEYVFGEILIAEALTTEIIELEVLRDEEELSFSLIDIESGELISDPVEVEFRCLPEGVMTPLTKTVIGGSDVVFKPGDCETLQYKVNEAYGYETIDYWNDFWDGMYIELERTVAAFAGDAGRILVNVSFEGIPIEDYVEVVLFKADSEFAAPGEGIYLESEGTITGQVGFEDVAPGYYYVQNESTSEYSSETSAMITLADGMEEIVELQLRRNVIGSIKVQVKNQAGQLIGDALVTLKKGNSTVMSRTTSLGEDATVEFSLSDSDEYNLVVTHDDYCMGELSGLTVGEALHVVTLRSDPSCKRKLRAIVIDQDGESVANATVGVYDEEGFRVAIDTKITDLNGRTEFTVSKTGKYKIFAFKGTISGWSDVKHYSPSISEQIEYIATLNIPDATVNVAAVNIEENFRPEQFASVTVFDSFDNRAVYGPKPIENEDGTITFALKADKKVYVMVEKEGMASFISEPFVLKPLAEHSVKAELMSRLIGGDVAWETKGSEFMGLFKEGQRVASIAAGEEYIARFKLKLPYDEDYDEMGFHLKTGQEGISNKMETDVIYIKESKAPGASSLEKGTAYNPGPAGAMAEDNLYKTEDGAKWVNLKWNQAKKGTVILEFRVKVKDIAHLGQRVMLDWSAYVTRDGLELRNPVDTRTIEELYKSTNEELFVVGEELLCDEKWCFSSSIIDKESRLVEQVSDSYAAKIGGEYEMNFKIINASEREEDNEYDAYLKIVDETENVEIKNYKIVGAQSQTENSMAGIVGFETPKIEVGDIEPNSVVEGEINFTTKKSNTGLLTFFIYSGDPALGQRIVLQKTISIPTSAGNAFDVDFEKDGEWEAEPPLLPIGKVNDLMVRVQNAETALEIEDAFLTVKNKFNDVLSTVQTNELGVARIVLPALQVGEKLKLTVEKPNYAVYEKTLNAEPDMLEIKPKKVGFSLNPKTAVEESKTISLTNKTELDLRVEEIALEGRFKGLIDEESAEDWLFTQYNGLILNALDEDSIVLKVKLSELGMKAEKTETVEGTLNLTLSGAGHTWKTSVPVKVSIGLGGEVDDPSCFSISKEEWITSTDGAPRSLQFRIENNCTVSEVPTKLDNLQAKVEWKSNHLGDYSVQTGEDTAELRPGYYKLVTAQLEEGEYIDAVLTFQPNGGVQGIAEATVFIMMENRTNSGMQELSNKIETKITITNLKDCIKFSKELIKVEKGNEEVLNIETVECGTEVDFELESLLDLSTKNFTMQGTDKKDITIYTGDDTYQGQYPVYVLTRGLERVEFGLEKLIRVRVLDKESCFELTKYEFDVYDVSDESKLDGFDVARLKNKCFEGPVKVKAKYKAKGPTWNPFDGDAWEKGGTWRAIGFGALAGFATGLAGCVGQGKGFGECISGSDDTEISAQDCLKNLEIFEEELGGNLSQECQGGFREAKMHLRNQGTANVDCEDVIGHAQKACKEEMKRAMEQPQTTGNNQVAAPAGPQALPLPDELKPPEERRARREAGTEETTGERTLIPPAGCNDASCKQICEYECGKEGKGCSVSMCKAGGECGYVCTLGPLAEQAAEERIPTDVDEFVMLLPPCNTNAECREKCTAYCDVQSNRHYGTSRCENEVCACGCAVEELAGQFALAVIPATGFQPMYANRQMGYGGGMGMQSVGNGVMGVMNGAMGMIGGVLTNPWAGAFVGGVTAAIYEGLRDRPSGSFEEELALNLIPFTDKARAKEMSSQDANKVMVHYPLNYPLLNLLKTKDTEFNAEGVTLFAGGYAAALEFLDIDTHLGEEFPFERSVVEFDEETFDPLELSANLIGENTIHAGETGFKEKEYELRIDNTIAEEGGLTQKEPYKPIYALLKVGGKEDKAKYKENVGKVGEKQRPLTEEDAIVEEAEDYYEKIMIQLNAWKEKPTDTSIIPVESCTVGALKGSTGENAMPRTLFDWSWGAITGVDTGKYYQCDEKYESEEDERKYVYCDATQFTIELLKKIEHLQGAIERAGITECPTTGMQTDLITQELNEYYKDVALTSIQVKQVEGEEGTVQVVVGLAENGHDVQMTANLLFEVAGQTRTVSAVEFTSNTLVEETFTGVEATDIGNLHEAIVSLTGDPAFECAEGTEECLNGDVTNDSINVNFSMSEGEVLTQCEPYNTTRLGKFAEVNEGLLGVTDYVTFSAHLMRDGYTSDFREDFKDFALTKTFFDFPGGTMEDLLVKYFINEDRFKFESPLFTPETPNIVDAGKYRVTIEIEYDSENPWKLYDSEDNPIANITVRFEDQEDPLPNSPFYYLPINGLIGVDSDDGRQGYGVNWYQPAEEAVSISRFEPSSDAQWIKAEDIPGSNPVEGAKVNVERIDSFQAINTGALRGIVLKVEREYKPGEALIRLYPSYAVPVVLKVEGGDRDEAFAYYSLELNGEPQTPASFLGRWSSLTVGCQDFLGKELAEVFPAGGTTDIRAGVGVSQCSGVGLSDNYYGLEWCDLMKAGEVHLSSMFFIPEKTSTASLTIASHGYQDNAEFVEPDTEDASKRIDLKTISERFDLFAETVQTVIEKISDEEICVDSYDNKYSVRFFWNPQKIVDEYYSDYAEGVSDSVYDEDSSICIK